jgi:hypothetical protein
MGKMSKSSSPPLSQPMPTILSVDLAIRPESVGVCRLHNGTVSFPVVDQACEQTLLEYQRTWQQSDGGEAAATAAAVALAVYIVQQQPDIVVIDGPQGLARQRYKRRRAEAILRTSGFTGEFFEAPKSGFSWPGIARLGIKVFDALSMHGYARLEQPCIQPKMVSLEVFPDACWHSFGIDEENLTALKSVLTGYALTWQGNPDEHELDAAVGVLTALAAVRGDAVYVGHPFFMDCDVPREGYIIVPNPSKKWIMNQQLYRAAVDEAGHSIYARRHNIRMKLVTIDPNEAPIGDEVVGGHSIPDSATIATLMDRIEYTVAGVAALRAMKLGRHDDVHQPDITDAIAVASPHFINRPESHVRAMVLNTLEKVEAELATPENLGAIRSCAEHLMAHKTIKGDEVNTVLDGFLT